MKLDSELKVADLCYLTGTYRGVARQSTNLKVEKGLSSIFLTFS